MCEIPAVYKCDTRKARKDHKCYECHGIIQKGEKYHNHHGVWDGSGSTYKVCVECDALRDQIDQGWIDYDELTPFGSLIESVFSSDNPTFMITYMYIAVKRGGHIQEWFLKSIDKALKEKNKIFTRASQPTLS